jgi:hypothetical protein
MSDKALEIAERIIEIEEAEGLRTLYELADIIRPYLVPEWISVKDSPPIIQDRYLVFYSTGSIDPIFTKGIKLFYNGRFMMNDWQKAIDWQPLPEDPHE